MFDSSLRSDLWIFFFPCCVSVCLFRPEARRLTNCGWLVLAWMSAGELLFYFAESPLTFISLHLLRDGDSKWQGLLSLFLLCLSVLSPPFFFHLSISCSIPPPPSSSLFLFAAASDMCIITLATIGTAQSKLNSACCGTLKKETLSVTRETFDGRQHKMGQRGWRRLLHVLKLLKWMR